MVIAFINNILTIQEVNYTGTLMKYLYFNLAQISVLISWSRLLWNSCFFLHKNFKNIRILTALYYTEYMEMNQEETWLEVGYFLGNLERWLGLN